MEACDGIGIISSYSRRQEVVRLEDNRIFWGPNALRRQSANLEAFPTTISLVADRTTIGITIIYRFFEGSLKAQFIHWPAQRMIGL